MREADDEIREIKTEIIESRGLIIKTNNLTSSLAADLKAIARRQAVYERRTTWNSAVAYVLFALLWSVGLKLWSDVRINEIEAEKVALSGEVDSLRNQLSVEVRRQHEREESAERALRHYALIQKRAYDEAVSAYPEVRQRILSPTESALFSEKDREFRAELSVRAYRAGRGLVEGERYAEGAEALQSALAYQDTDSPLAPEMRLQLAQAYTHLGRHDEAMPLAQAVLEQTRNRELQDDAALLLAQCAQGMGEIAEAQEAYQLLLRRWPKSALAVDARRGLLEVTRRYLATGPQR